MRISVFTILSLLIVIMIGRVYHRAFLAEDFPIFIDEETILDTESLEFGFFAEYL